MNTPEVTQKATHLFDNRTMIRFEGNGGGSHRPHAKVPGHVVSVG